jgi:hypothetical protein
VDIPPALAERISPAVAWASLEAGGVGAHAAAMIKAHRTTTPIHVDSDRLV